MMTVPLRSIPTVSPVPAACFPESRERAGRTLWRAARRLVAGPWGGRSRLIGSLALYGSGRAAARRSSGSR